MLGRHGGEQVGGEGGDAAFARQIIAEEGDLPNFGGGIHDTEVWRPLGKISTPNELSERMHA